MPQISNPNKKFQFTIFIAGMNPFLAQKVTVAERSIEQVEHGEGNHVIKTGGMITLGNVMVEKLFFGVTKDLLIYSWLSIVQSEVTGGGAISEVYKRAMQIQLLHPNGVTPVRLWNYLGVWPCKINGVELDRTSSDNTIESIEFSVDKEAVV